MSFTTETGSSIAIAGNTPNHEIEFVLVAARQELQGLLEQRSALLRRISTVRRAINGLVDTFGGAVSDERLARPPRPQVPDTKQRGLTTACRAVLIQSGEALSAVEVAEKIRKSNGEVLRNHKNSLSSVTTILRRLESYGEATTQLNHSGQRVWTWCMPDHGTQ